MRERSLDHCYTPFRKGYKAVSLPPFGKSDHAALFLLQKYKQRTVREVAVTRDIKRWFDQSEAMLQDALSGVDWNMFQSSSRDISEFAEAVTVFIATIANNIGPTVRVSIFPNQKPWVDRSIHIALNGRTAAYNSGLSSGNMDDYKAESYGLRRQ